MWSPPRPAYLIFPFIFIAVAFLYCYHQDQETGSLKIPTRPELSFTRDTITALDNKTFMVSAFYDSRVGPSVRTIAIIHKSVEELYCLFHCSEDQDIPVQAEIDHHKEWFGFPYGTAALLCREPLPCDYRYVSFRSPDSTNQSEKIQFEVQNRPEPTPSFNFTVCISTLYGGFSNVLQMIQSIEMYKILGASRVTIYNTSCSRDVDKVLQHYIDEGTLEVVPWPIDQHLRTSNKWHYSEGLSSQVGYYGQTTTLNDCLYRNMYKSKYVFFNDIDELILPVTDQDWSSLMERLQTQLPEASVFLFETHRFPVSVRVPEFDRWTHVTGRNILHQHYRKPNDPNARNPRKMVLNPRKVFETSIHYVPKFTGTSVHVPSSLAINFHCNLKSTKNITTGLIRDDRLWRYNMSLVLNVDEVVQKLFPEP